MGTPVPDRAIVLSAGLGMRLRPLTLVRAKPAIPVAGEPLIRRILRWLADQGIAEAVVNLHHLPSTLTAIIGDGGDLGLRVRYSWEQPMVLGSAGGVRHALDIIGTSPFLIVNGDTLTDVDLHGLAAAHCRSGAQVTLALAPNRDPQRYGGVRLDTSGSVTGFVRRGADAEGSFHFVGVQIGEASAFAGLPDGRPMNSVGESYNELILNRPGSIAGFVSEPSFWDIGTVADYLNTSRAFNARFATAERATIHKDARVVDSILWDDVEIGAGASLDRCIVTDGVKVPPGSAYSGAILRADSGHLVVGSLND